ncbi:uncharacterized protein LOC135331569 isoform X2 [Halichondria panicea]
MSSMEDSPLTPTKDSEELEDYSEQDRLQESDSPPTPKRRCLQDSQPDTPLSTVEYPQDLDYIITPMDIRCTNAHEKALCFLDLSQLDEFVERLNEIRQCPEPACRGNLVPTSVKRGIGGAATITYNCDGCRGQELTLDTCKVQEDGRNSEITRALHVAFIISGCTFTTYTKVLRYSLGIQSTYDDRFQDTIRTMHPVVKKMVDEMCTEAKEAMKQMKPEELGSWKRAVTVADGAWMTRGHHSKNFTFSIRNYFTGELLFRIHLSQKGGDNLYKGTSKGAEGYAARKLFQQAKEEGMKLEINRQDDDSSTSKAIRGIYEDVEIMMCRGHEGRSHLNQLKKLMQMKAFTSTMFKSHQNHIADIQNKPCSCSGKKHKKGCGCFTDQFIKNSRNLFSKILSNSESKEEFEKKTRSLYHHAIDEHVWDGGSCDFHALKVCSCGECPDKTNFVCEGQEYHTRDKLTCPFHMMAYRTEIEHRARKSSSLIHPELKAGHTNSMESSHNILIRFRQKHISLEKSHYELSTELGLLQANLTSMRKNKGPHYHWIPVLYQRLGLPLYTGIEDALEKYGKSRDKQLREIKEDKHKKRRIRYKVKRKMDREERIKWSKKLGDAYGCEWRRKRTEKDQAATKLCKCGSSEHRNKSHRDCPLNKRHASRDARSHPKSEKQGPSSAESDENNGTDASVNRDSSDSSESDFEDQILHAERGECICPNPKAHKRNCPAGNRNRGKRLFQTFKPGDKVAIHVTRLSGKHLVCRIAQVTNKRYTLHSKRGTLLKRFGGSELHKLGEDEGYEIPLDNWRQSEVVSTRALQEEDMVSCSCAIDTPDYLYVEDDDSEEDPDTQQGDNTIQTSIYCLSSTDINKIDRPTGWLNDIVITASQHLLYQHFPHIEGLQPPTLQAIRGFNVNKGEFVQILNVSNMHWCVVSTVGCSPGQVNVYDTMYRSVQKSTIPIIASLMLCTLPNLTINMMDVGRQTNGSDCGVLAIAIAYDLCAGNDPLTVVYEHTSTRQHLKESLKKCCFDRFPIRNSRTSTGVIHAEHVSLYCTCRMPEESIEDDPMAECDVCKGWYHRSCLSIPNEVFQVDGVEWKCEACTEQS